MSLLSTATVWTNDNIQPKKRVSTMKKTMKTAPYTEPTNMESAQYRPSDINSYASDNDVPDNIKTLQDYNENKVDRVNELINKITFENDGNKLADDVEIFVPAFGLYIL